MSPLHQFAIKPLIKLSLLGYDVSFTNSSLFMLLATFSVCSFLILSTKKISIVPSKLQIAGELLYQLIGNMLEKNVGARGKKFKPVMLSMFLFILSCNLFGMLPYGFTVTSHIVVTFVLAFFIFIVITITGFVCHGLKFLSLFLPKGTPGWLAPLMIIIELFAYLARPVSLSLRLAANMTAGHILLKVIAGFVVVMSVFMKPLPIPLIIILIGFEFCVAILQAYIFTILACVYLNDAVNLH